MIHTMSLFWVSVSLFLGIKLSTEEAKKISYQQYLLLGFSCAMAIICRPTNGIILAPFALYYLVQNKRIKSWITPALAACLPLGIQAWVWQKMFGSPLYYSYKEEGFLWGQPQILNSLFSSNHGLYFWSPLLLPASLLAIEKGLNNKGNKLLWRLLLLSFALITYVNSCWHMWWFGDAFGARSYTEMSLIFIAGISLLFSSQLLQKKPYLPKALVFFSLAFNWGLMLLYIGHKIPRAGTLY